MTGMDWISVLAFPAFCATLVLFCAAEDAARKIAHKIKGGNYDK